MCCNVQQLPSAAQASSALSDKAETNWCHVTSLQVPQVLDEEVPEEAQRAGLAARHCGAHGPQVSATKDNEGEEEE